VRRLLSLALATAVAAAVGGCGYSTESLYTSRYSTIAVDIFKNETRYRDFEFTLANAIKNEIVSKTDLRLARHDDAETVLTGSIKSYEEHVVTETTTDVVRELEVKIVLAFEWRDLKTGQVIHSRAHFEKTADAKFPLGETRDTAAAKVLADVAESIINDLEKGW
jgi:hypothetical protein